MRLNVLLRRAPFVVAGIFATTSIVACAHPREYSDPVYNDSHRWNSREDAAYRRWEAERRIEHREYESRKNQEQREYWTWRHSHPE
jgi:hypothetical protein